MKRILWIDDEADSEAMVSRCELLASAGVLVDRCAQLTQVEPRLRTEGREYDAIVVDMIMPPSDLFTLADTQGGLATGISLIAEIRKWLPRHPIVVVSARDDTGIQNRLDALGVAEYVTKPCDVDTLIDAIQKAVESA